MGRRCAQPGARRLPGGRDRSPAGVRQLAHSLGAQWSASTEATRHQGRRTHHNLPGPPRCTTPCSAPAGGLAPWPPGRPDRHMSSSFPPTPPSRSAAGRERGVHTLRGPVGGGIPPRADGSLQLVRGRRRGGVRQPAGRCSRCRRPGPHPPPRPHGRRLHGEALVNLLWFGQAMRPARRCCWPGPRLDCGAARGTNSSSAASTFLRRDPGRTAHRDLLESFRPGPASAEELGALDAMPARTACRRAVRSGEPHPSTRARISARGSANCSRSPLLEEQAGTQLRYDR